MPVPSTTHPGGGGAVGRGRRSREGARGGATGASVARVARRALARRLCARTPCARAPDAHAPPTRTHAPTRARTRRAWYAGVHPLHIAVKREYTDCIAFLMGRDLPLDKVKEELGWACQFDLSQSVYCLLENGAPHAQLDLPYIPLHLAYISPISRLRGEGAPHALHRIRALLAWAILATARLRRWLHRPWLFSCAGAPHGLRVLCPWTSSSRRQQNSKDYSLPLGYYWVRRARSAAAAPSAAPAAPQPLPQPQRPQQL